MIARGLRYSQASRWMKIQLRYVKNLLGSRRLLIVMTMISQWRLLSFRRKMVAFRSDVVKAKILRSSTKTRN